MALQADHRARMGQPLREVKIGEAVVREMHPYEAEIVAQYFRSMASEAMDVLGVDPTPLPEWGCWMERLRAECALPFRHRSVLPALWTLHNEPFGFSTADKIAFGDQANMHMHIVDPSRLGVGLGAECVRQSAWLYFELLRVQRVFCEPPALNIAANRTLQRAGFKYLATYWAAPGALSFRRPVTRWVAERGIFGAA